jgi:hypothetical protein
MSEEERIGKEEQGMYEKEGTRKWARDQVLLGRASSRKV